ncbi:MAG: type II secretion system F family protein [Chromatiales bacterium]|nr:type II secretion system F family protein [Chromatiales bacterium]
MPQSTFMLVLAGLAGSTILLAGLALVIYRETQRAVAFDRRLSASRRQAVAARLWSDLRERRGAGRSGALGLALLRIGSALVPVGAGEREKLAGMLRLAGFGQRESLSVFLSVKFACALAACALAGWQATGSDLLGRHGVLVTFAVLAGFFVGGILPEYGLRFLIARRSRRMASTLPDALDLMVMCLESGLTFERSIATVAGELQPIEPNLAREFRLMEAELGAGADRRAVLQEFQRRTEVEGLRDFAMTLIQSERYGTPLAQSMKNIAANERTQRAARIEAQAERLPVLMTLPMLLFVVPGFMCLVAGPAFLTAIRALGALGGGA